MAQYVRLAAGGVDGVTLTEPDVTMTTAAFTSRTDRFWKPTVNIWRRNTSSVNFVDLAMTYDQAGNMVTLQDNVLKDAAGTPKRAFDQALGYDALRRLIEQDEGELSGSTIGNRKRKEAWTRTLTAGVSTTTLDLDGDGVLTGAGEWDDDRTYNWRNELRTRDTNGSSPVEFTLAYDKNGNLTSDGENFTYVYNPWCQLVYVKNLAATVTVAAYTYNGLGMRISSQTDTSSSTPGLPDGIVDGDDSIFYIVNDLHGRRVATYRGTDADPKETYIWHAADLVGPAFKGGPILRDRNATLGTNPEDWDDDAAGSTRAERIYYCTDYQGSVVALVGPTGTLQEQVRYSATGVPYGIPLGDVDSDGINNSTTGGDSDYDVITAIMGGSYDVRGDLDLDGDVDSADRAIAQGRDGETAGRLIASSTLVRSNIVSIRSMFVLSQLRVSGARTVFVEVSVALIGQGRHCGLVPPPAPQPPTLRPRFCDPLVPRDFDPNPDPDDERSRGFSVYGNHCGPNHGSDYPNDCYGPNTPNHQNCGPHDRNREPDGTCPVIEDGGTDQCCLLHDQCDFDACVEPVFFRRKSCHQATCDASMCACLRRAQPCTDSERMSNAIMQALFCSGNGDNPNLEFKWRERCGPAIRRPHPYPDGMPNILPAPGRPLPEPQQVLPRPGEPGPLRIRDPYAPFQIPNR